MRYTNVVCGRTETFKSQKQNNNQRLKDGLKKFREAMELDAKASAARGSGLPRDWRSRILK